MTPIADIATSAMGFTSLGPSPGISDSGEVVAFYGENADGAGVFISISDGSGARRIIRVAGRPNELGTDAANNPLSFIYFASNYRAPVVHRAAGAAGIEDDIFIVAFRAWVWNGVTEKNGIWTVRVDMRRLNGVLRELISTPQPVVQQGDVINGYTINGVSDLGDAIADGGVAGEHFIAVRSYTNAGTVIIRAEYEQRSNPLIFIPGTMGSEIRGSWNGLDVPFWINYNTTATVNLPSVYHLTLDESETNYYTEGLYASDVLQTGWSGVYKPLIDSLKEKGYRSYDYSRHLLSIQGCDESQINADPTLNPSLFVFPYDWRQDNNISADKLKDYIECVQKFYPPGRKIDILAHSQGGLVARRYVLQAQTANEPHGLNRVITIATSFLGAPEATYRLYTGGGWRLLSVVATPLAIQFLSPSFPSVHQLLPSRKYHELEGYIVAESGDVNGNGIPDEIYDFEQNVSQLNANFPATLPGTVGAEFHDLAGQDDWSADQSGIQYSHLVGVQKQPNTTHGLTVVKSVQCRLLGTGVGTGGRCFQNRLLFIPEKERGDKTVPTVSATRIKQTAGGVIDLNSQTKGIYIWESPSASDADEEWAEHNGIHKENTKTHALVAYLLGVGPRPNLNPASYPNRLADEKNNDRQSRAADFLGETTNYTEYLPGEYPAPPNLENSSPARYLTIIGRTEVVVRDGAGNVASIQNGLLNNQAEGLSSYEVIGDDSIMLTLAVGHSYTIEFPAGETPMAIELVEGRGNRQPTAATRYKDLNIPVNAKVKFSVSQTGAIELKYDADNNGEYETTIAPTVSLSGAAASDTTLPTVNVSVVQQGNTATATITAQDAQSGISRIWYSLDGQNFQIYTAPLTLQYSTTPVVIYSFADDVVANRSGLYSKSFAFSQTLTTIRHGFNLNGRIEGSVQQLLGENSVLNSSAVLTGDLFVPGSPNLIRNGTSVFGGTVIGTGNAQPGNYSVTLNGGSRMGRLMTRTDATAMSTVAAPPAPAGTLNVTINNASQSIGDFTALRNLTLNGNVGQKAIPPGTYGNFTANGGSGFIIGVAGGSQPAVYNLSSLTLNSNSQLQVVGPVILTLGTGLTLNASAGTSINPNWLQIKVASGGITLNSGSVLYGSVHAPSGTVTINSRLVGNVTADRLTINSGGILQIR